MKWVLKKIPFSLIFFFIIFFAHGQDKKNDEKIVSSQDEIYYYAEKKYIRNNNRDTFRFFQDTTIENDKIINGNIIIIRANLIVKGEIDGDILAIFGDVYIYNNAVVTGNITSVGGSIKQYENSIVSGIQIETSPSNILHKRPDNYQKRNFSVQTSFRNQYSTLPLGDLEDRVILRYNRVQGLFLGLELPKTIRGKYHYFSFHGFGGYGFEEERWRYQLGLDRYFFDQDDYRFELGVKMYDLTDTRDEWIITSIENSLASFFIREDFQDYYRRSGAEFYLSQNITIFLKGTISYRDDKYGSVKKNTDWALFGGRKRFRENPEIDKGIMHSIMGEIYLDTRNNHKLPTSGWYGRLSMELSNSKINSDFFFNQYILEVRHYMKLTRRERLDTRVKLGTSEGQLPLQKIFELGGISSLRAFKYKEFKGNRMILLNCEYNISSEGISRDLPFLNNVQLIPFFDMGAVWFYKVNENWLAGFNLLKWGNIKSDIGLAVSDRKDQFRISIAKRTDTGYKPFKITLRLAKPF
jgi:hypothetical protein